MLCKWYGISWEWYWRITLNTIFEYQAALDQLTLEQKIKMESDIKIMLEDNDLNIKGLREALGKTDKAI